MSNPVVEQGSGASPCAVADVLEAAAKLIEPEGAWTQGTYARTSAGLKTDTLSREATCFCMAGAVARILGESSYKSALYRTMQIRRDALVPVIGPNVASFNDAPGRTQSAVVAKLREAAAKARAEASK